MAHSDLSFGTDGFPIRDDLLGAILRRMRIYANRTPGADGWLGSAVEAWLAKFDVLPGGCRDIELQEWLTSEQRRTELLSALDWAREELLRASAAGTVDLTVVPFEKTLGMFRNLITQGGR